MDKQGQCAALPCDRGLFLVARRKKSVHEVVPSYITPHLVVPAPVQKK